MGLLNPYIKEEWKSAVKSYKFKGSDASLFYNYVTSPICTKLVEFIPSYIA